MIWKDTGGRMKVFTQILFPNDQKENVVIKLGLFVGRAVVEMTHRFL